LLFGNNAFVHAFDGTADVDSTKAKTGFRYGIYDLAPGKKKQLRKGYDGSGFNIKAMPALFWNSASVEMEIPVHKSFSIAVNGTFKLGRTDGKQSNFRVNPAEYLDNGFRVDLHVRYFPVSYAPFGFYADAFASYGQIVYFDGTTRPYSLLNRVKEKDDLRSPSNITKPQPFGAGAGVGYQILLIPKKVVANFFFGLQTNIDGDNTIFLSGFVAPSLGILF
jgi:hypothetical protein